MRFAVKMPVYLWLCCEMWQTDIVSDLYIAVWKDLNSCKQHCNQCPICSHVPLVWMPFCHFFHPLPSGCLRTSNPEKRAHLPKEERSKLDFWVCLLAGKLGCGRIYNSIRMLIICKICHSARKNNSSSSCTETLFLWWIIVKITSDQLGWSS